MQHEGEVEICTHDFHLTPTPQNTEQKIALVHEKRAAAHAGEPQAGLVEGWINVRHDDLPAWNYLILHPTEAHALEVRKISSNTIRTVLVREVRPQSNRQHAGEGKTAAEEVLIQFAIHTATHYTPGDIEELLHQATLVAAERAPLVGREKKDLD